MFFVVSTGRCGSMTIANTLNRLPGIVCVHEPEPVLVEEARAYMRSLLSRDALVEVLRKTRRSSKHSLRYGESNQKLSYMVDALMHAFPDACFIWLVRNGIDVVASMLRQQLYRDDIPQSAPRRTPWGQHRLRANEVGEMSQEQWQGLSPFAAYCWYWNWTNRKIQRDLSLFNIRR